MIIAIGNPVYDYIKTQVLATDGRVLSGCSTNAALALAKLGKSVKLIGALAKESENKFVGDLDRHRIDCEIFPSKETGGFSLVYYDDFGNRTLDLLGRADPIGDLDPRWYHDAEAVLIAPILREVSFDMIQSIRDNYNGLFFCDPQGLLRGAHDDDRIYHEKPEGIEDILGMFDIVKPNELEGKVLTGIDCREDPYEAARIIKSWGPKLVIVTLAELGSVIYDGEQFIDIPAHPVKLIDSTGAGDTYMAGFTYEYLNTDGDLKKSGCFASCVSSYMIEQVGPEFTMVEAEVRERQATLLAQTDFKVPVAVNS
ncbi:MAG: ribokinase [bacterium]|nr:ribokinase [bacterium]